MDKKAKIILVIAIIVIAIIAVVCISKSKTSNGANNGGNGNDIEPPVLDISSADDLINILNRVYADIPDDTLPKLETTEIDVKEKDSVTLYTGLEDGNNLEYLIVSQPLMSSQAYSVVLASVNGSADANNIAREMCEKVDTRRWICVEADQVYATSINNIVFLVMTDAENAKLVLDTFQAKTGAFGQVYEKAATLEELPPDMY